MGGIASREKCINATWEAIHYNPLILIEILWNHFDNCTPLKNGAPKVGLYSIEKQDIWWILHSFLKPNLAFNSIC